MKWTGPQKTPWNEPYSQWVFRYIGDAEAYPLVLLALTSPMGRSQYKPWNVFYHKPYLFLNVVCGSTSARNRLDLRLQKALRVAREEKLLVPWQTPMDPAKKTRLLRYFGGPTGLRIYRDFRDLDSQLIVELLAQRKGTPFKISEVVEHILWLKRLLSLKMARTEVTARARRYAARMTSLALRIRRRSLGRARGENLLHEAYLLSHLSTCGLDEASENAAIKTLLTEPRGKKEIHMRHYRLLV